MAGSPPDIPIDYSHWSRWQRFWHQPMRAEVLASARISFGVAILASQLIQYLPNLAYLFGPDGVAPAGVNDEFLQQKWRWPVLFFTTDDMLVIGLAFGVWMAATLAMLVGFCTRIATILVWLGMMCFLARNPNLKNGGDDLAQVAVFLLMISPCARAMSVDRWLRIRAWKRKHAKQDPDATPPDILMHPMIAPWAVRLFQIQLCVMYFITGLAKLRGSTWWEGVSVHNALNDVTMTRWSFSQFPIPIWITGPLNYGTLIFEVFFPLFVLFRKTRWLILWAGVGFHVGIWVTIEVGWFSFYSLAMYAVWIPVVYWDRLHGRRDSLLPRPA